ncbi:MAG: GGDEF domain-containing protein [Alphaproteobacteria bacterium]
MSVVSLLRGAGAASADGILGSDLSLYEAGGSLPADLRGLLERARAMATEAKRRLARQEERIHELEALSMTDELTGLFNRRGFLVMLDRAIRAAARERCAGVVGYLDLDEFKAINDRHGHDAGDEALRRVADELRAQVRPDDAVARLGGDEFAILLTRTAAPDGYRRLRAIERRIDATALDHDGRRIELRGSVGVATIGTHDDRQRALARADRAMYRRKMARRRGPMAVAGR